MHCAGAEVVTDQLSIEGRFSFHPLMLSALTHFKKYTVGWQPAASKTYTAGGALQSALLLRIPGIP